MNDTIERTTTEKLTEPANGWVNRWKITQPFRWLNGDVQPAATYEAPDTWPSKDIAEQKAADWLAKEARTLVRLGADIRYLGAFPVTP